MSRFRIMSSRIRQRSSYQIKTRSSLGRNSSCLQRCTSTKKTKTGSKAYSTSSAKAYKNASLTKERNSSPTYNWLEADRASLQLPTDFKGSWLKLILVGMDPRWKCLPQTRNQKDRFLAGWGPLLCPLWEYLTSGSFPGRSTKKTASST